eukprot:8058076-Pyramimonas_sp.AAC.1
MENQDGQVHVESHAAYMSLLGGIAWMAWIMATVKQLGARFIALSLDRARLAVISDSAFHAMEFEGLAIRGCVIMLLEASEEVLKTGSTHKIVMLDWYSRKQNNVVRSTYAAELMALLDALGTGALLDVALTEINEGVCSANRMRARQENGDLTLKMMAAIDAKAVFDAASAAAINITADKR